MLSVFASPSWGPDAAQLVAAAQTFQSRSGRPQEKQGDLSGGGSNDVRTSKGRGKEAAGLNSFLVADHLRLRGDLSEIPPLGRGQCNSPLQFNCCCALWSKKKKLLVKLEDITVTRKRKASETPGRHLRGTC